MFDVAIIGCGIVGAAAAYELSRYKLSVVVLEAENDVAAGTTKANSAIIHAGYDPAPESLMAKLNVQGAILAKELCEKLDVPYKQIGSLVLAFSQDDLSMIQKLYKRGIDNGVPDLKLLNAAEVLLMEPNINTDVLGALYAPSAAIVNPWEYALALAETAVKNGVKIVLNCRVTSAEKTKDGYHISAKNGEYEAKYVINAAGINTDIIHNLISTPCFKILPSKGEYYLLDKCEGSVVNHVIFQCPGKEGKGVLISPTVHGNLIVGPNSHSTERDDIACTSEGLLFVAQMSRKSVPSVNLRNSIRNFAGVRAIANVKDDFIIAEAEGAPGWVDLAGIKSPGLSAAPAIAKMATDILSKAGLILEEKNDFIDERTHIRFNHLSDSQKTELIAKIPAYGRVICRCETITEGEIIDAVHSPIPPCSVDGIKRRAGAGMGRCQGGFCSPRVVEILSRKLGICPEQVMQDKEGTVILIGETKGEGK